MSFPPLRRLKSQRGRGLAPLVWADYLFIGVEKGKIREPTFLSDQQAQSLTRESSFVFAVVRRRLSFWHRLSEFLLLWERPISDLARLVGSLSIWLKECVVPTLHVVAAGIILPAVSLAYGVRIALIHAVITNIQSGLRQVVVAFLEFPKKNLWVKLACTQLVAWYVLYCPGLMTPKLVHGVSEPFVQHLTECSQIASCFSSIFEIFDPKTLSILPVPSRI